MALWDQTLVRSLDQYKLHIEFLFKDKRAVSKQYRCPLPLINSQLYEKQNLIRLFTQLKERALCNITDQLIHAAPNFS